MNRKTLLRGSFPFSAPFSGIDFTSTPFYDDRVREQACPSPILLSQGAYLPGLLPQRCRFDTKHIQIMLEDVITASKCHSQRKENEKMKSIMSKSRSVLPRWASLSMSAVIVCALVGVGFGNRDGVASNSGHAAPTVTCPAGQCFTDVVPGNTFY